MVDCSVCCEKLNVSNRKRVTCPFCDFCACRGCVQQYLLTLSNDPHCMGCRKLWARDVIDEACTATFRNGPLKKHRETILFEREKCLMPGTVPAVARVKKIRSLEYEIYDANVEVAKAQAKVNALADQRTRLLRGGSTLVDESERRAFVRKCPVQDCKGFLSTRWKCELCENTVCRDCNEILTEGHVCDPGAVETVALLRKDTKPCPNCGTMIFKISGCAQMWCPDCHVAFDWNTMRIEKGLIHNPHFYEFRRRNAQIGREHGDIPCGGLPDVTDLYVLFNVATHRRFRYYDAPELKNKAQAEVVAIHRLVNHIQGVEIREEAPVDTEPMRIQYMMNELDEETFKKTLQKNEKAREKRRDITHIFRMFCDVTGDYLRQLVLKAVTLEEFLDTMVRLREYTNEAFGKVKKRYACSSAPVIRDDWSPYAP